MATEITINAPGTQSPSFNKPLVVEELMGKWHVVRSTLPMWKNKKDVTITYTPRAQAIDQPISFDDLVEYRSASAAADSSPSTVRGVDKQDPAFAQTYNWRGSGWLMIASSRWEIIGLGDDWAVTYFSSTLFTPEGLDIYVRQPGNSSVNPVSIMLEVEKLDGRVGELAKTFFEVPVSSAI
ncbi:hypothetical protein BKA62DRAFT_721409 [Auriculariales sp. MPI-PUGE-AT-0066]|nr:hypothetical protein BKA62DRAFT_721409 [Auriculariales sp. MPI-PUGE-AT-0066]